MPFVERRKFRRINVHIGVSFYCNDTDYKGIIINISKGGMFIKTSKLSFPLESEFNVLIRRPERILNLPVKVCWLSKTGGVFDGMGVKVTDQAPEYIAFVNSLLND